MRTVVAIRVLGVVLCAATLAAGQDQKANLQRSLESQYVFTRAGAGNVNIITPGTVLVIQKDGMIGDGQSTVRLTSTPNNYKDGRFKHGIVGAILNVEGVRPFQTGERVYLLKIEVKDSDVVFTVLSCDPIDGTRYKSNVSFQFGKGFMSSPDIGRVQQTIAEVFTVEEGGPATAGQPAQSGQGSGQPAMAPIPAPAPPPDQPPPSIELGQTPEQVVAIMGQPQKVIKLADKQIYIYKDLKVTFKNGKVADVE